MFIEQTREDKRMIKELFDANMQLARQKNEADNNALDRELVREEKKLLIEVKRRGVNLLAGLLPDFFHKVTNGVGRSRESLAVEQTLDALSAEDRVIVFGEWTDDGVRTKPGILSEQQVLLIRAILRDQVDPAQIERLLEGPDQIVPEQYIRISERVELEKFTPLIILLKERKARSQNGSAAPKPKIQKDVPPPAEKVEADARRDPPADV